MKREVFVSIIITNFYNFIIVIIAIIVCYLYHHHMYMRIQDLFINAQWAVGVEGTGAPVHFHNTAWNALIYGAKKWVIYPPHFMIMSNKQILDFFETDMKSYADRGIK